MESCPFSFARNDFDLAEVTLYGVGGPADMALLPRTRSETVEAFFWMKTQDVPSLVLGGGSNVLIRDGGFPGIVLFTDCLMRCEEHGDGRFTIESGIELDTMVREVLIAHNYAGVGGLTGIPGSVGGAIYMNAGTVNGSICELMTSVDVLREDGEHRIPMKPDLYRYRGQQFCAPGELILGGEFQFAPADTDQQAVYDHYIARRKEKQPQGRSCGSVFKNPPDDHAGRLIEACGLKGRDHGGARISPLHGNFIVNENGASCADILELVALCKSTVRDKFGIELEEEVRVFGVD